MCGENPPLQQAYRWLEAFPRLVRLLLTENYVKPAFVSLEEEQRTLAGVRVSSCK